MIFTKLQIYKLLVITLILRCQFASVSAGKLPKSQTKINNTEIKASAEAAEVSVTTTDTEAAAIKETESKSSEEEQDDDANETAEKNAVQPTAETSLSIWGIVRGLWNWIREDISESLFSNDGKTSAVGEGRTFGKIRRLQMALIPIIFKFGVLSAMVAFLVGLGIKTLFLVKVLVVMNLLALLAKFFTLNANLGHVEHVAHHAPAFNWSPYMSNGWHSVPEKQHINKEIHLHIHGGQTAEQLASYSHGNGAAGQHQDWHRRNDPYSTYGSIALQQQQNELLSTELASTVNSVAASGQHLTSSFPGNHRMFSG